MGIRDRPISPRSPWQNAYVERLIGTWRRDCLDHVLIFGEADLRRVLTIYSTYFAFADIEAMAVKWEMMRAKMRKARQQS
jgi:hypothetical protein